MESWNTAKNPFALLDGDGDDSKTLSVRAEPAPVVTAPWLIPSQKGKGSRKEEEKKRLEAEKKKKKAAEKSRKVEEEMKQKREEQWKQRENEEKAKTLAEYEKEKAEKSAAAKKEERRVAPFEAVPLVGKKKEEVVFGLSQMNSEKQKGKKKQVEKSDKLPKPMSAEEFQRKYGPVQGKPQTPNAGDGASSSSSHSPAEENTPNVDDTAEFPGLSSATAKGQSRRVA